ncbi:MAG: MBL fold metallo-hydrolase [Candidatus Poseidoniaceae archaeon]|nr:MBL fold metallo-hydrolase [Candidatus Poseidoniaceae archaeon]
MSEVPEGVNLPAFARKPPRPTVTLTLTRDGVNGVEVLLGRRAESMRAFPGYWAFPGGGVSRTDHEGEAFVQNTTSGSTSSVVAVVREMTEELGVVPNGSSISPIDVELRKEILSDKMAFINALKEGNIELNTSDLRHISSRTTPPFGPMQFENTFFHLHIGTQEFNPSTELQTEFTALEWMKPSEMIERWKRHEIRVAPPVVTLLMEVDRTLNHFNGNMIQTAEDLQERQPGRRSILFAHGVEVVPVKTATLPPADHTNAYFVGDPEGEFVLVDPACRMREGMEQLAEAVDRHRGELVAILFTHSHGDHIGDMDLLREAFDVPVWGSEYTSRTVHCDRILEDGETLQLGSQHWTVLITPGHHPGHICLHSGAGLVAGDMVAGIGTILIPPGTGDMDVYIEQLQRLKALEPHLMFPSHGPVIPLPEKTLNYYIKHRMERHQRVLDAVTSGLRTISEISIDAYSNTPDAHPGLAQDQTLAHLLSHERANRVKKTEQGWIPGDE